ncbi:pyridoxal-phosphate-dependent aminotransferase family protein [Microvirgula aerodenitrificans]|uniref:pyridoxal-phosphate-dependent aminotransferase family protein n=1 Tax=Microvirgula aerodenitrificans TaxID=57480 RepID=UPI00048EBB85|nr:alanine--glyoxylate aminotransferase family protein [Microvirgula aerodenitrificans]
MKTKKLVMIPGPTPVVRSIQEQMGRETAAFGDPDFVRDFTSLLNDLKSLWKTTGEVFVVAGTGTLGMEMAVANSLRAGDRVLVVSHGYFGDRFSELCSRRGIEVDVLASEWGRIVPLEQIERALASKNYQAITVTHVDTSTGVCAPVAEIGQLLRRFPDTLYIVDGVCATAAEPEYVDDMGIDILLTGSQKAFGVPPGLAILWAGPKALARRASLGTIPDYYIDFDKWLPIMHEPAKYFATPAVNLVWALKEAVRLIKEEGLENRYARHRRTARAMQAALEALGFQVLAEADHRAVTLSNLIYPSGADDAAFRRLLAEEGVMVAGGLAAYAGRMFRLGHMGNIDAHDLVATLAAIERAAVRSGIPVELGTGLAVLQRELVRAAG